MLPSTPNYAIFPTVIPADKPTEITILPTEPAFLFFEGAQYTLTIIPVNGDEDYYTPHNRTNVTVTAQGGVLRFTYTFAGEQEHLIILSYEEKKRAELAVYSLYEDLYALTPLKGDLHVHSYRSDGRRDPAALAGHYREQGYDFFALTDHNRYYPSNELQEAFEGVQLGLTLIHGEEVHTPKNTVHIVHTGGNRSVTEEYVRDVDGYFEILKNEYMPRVPESVPEQYRERYAAAMWSSERIRKAGGLIIFPHPYWRPGSSRAFNVCDEFAKILLTSGLFDAYELIGGMLQDGNNRSVALWNELRANNGLNIAVVGSSDVHNTDQSKEFPHQFTICFAESTEANAIIDAVRKHRSVAVEASGVEYSREYRCYGSLRLVSYAQFLLRYFFPQQQRICQGEGTAMRSYLMGTADAALIEEQAKHSIQFRNRFLGKQPPRLPSTKLLAFEEKWRQTQLEGPISKGSSILTETVSRQI